MTPSLSSKTWCVAMKELDSKCTIARYTDNQTVVDNCKRLTLEQPLSEK